MSHKLILLVVLLISCKTSSQLERKSLIREDYNDVFLLSVLIQERLQHTNELEVNLSDLIKNDRRIHENFEKIELKTRGGYISVYYIFSDLRDNNKVELSSDEKVRLNVGRWIKRRIDKQYDGEIQFEYGERFYHKKKIVINEE